MTVFAAMSFMIIASVICAMIESARVQGARVMVAMAADMALDGLFSGYERELLDKYGILLFDGAGEGSEPDGGHIAAQLKEKIERRIKEKESLDIVFRIIDSNEPGLFIGSMTSQVLAIFYLNDLVSDDYKSINFYLDFDNFNRTDPRPQTVEEWNILYNRQMEFLNKRNSRIDKSING